MLFVNSSKLLFRYFSRDPISLPRVCLKYLLKKKKVKKLRICVTENSFIRKLGRTTHSDQLQKKKEKTKSISNEAPVGIFLTCRVIDTQVWSDPNVQKNFI